MTISYFFDNTPSYLLPKFSHFVEAVGLEQDDDGGMKSFSREKVNKFVSDGHEKTCSAEKAARAVKTNLLLY